MLKVDLDYDAVHKILAADLKDSLETLSADFGKVVVTGKGFVFTLDANEDAKKIKKLMKAMVRVHNWYTAQDEHLEIKDYV